MSLLQCPPPLPVKTKSAANMRGGCCARWLLPVLVTLHTLLVTSVTPVAILPAHLMLRADDDDPFIAQQGHHGAGRYALQMRPSPSDDLPVEPPEFPSDKQFLPKEADLSPHKLRKILGPDYESAFMSSVRPLESIHTPNGTLAYDLKRARKVNGLPAELRSFSIDVNGHRKRLKMRNRKLRRRVLRFLSLYSFCPVHYQWKDLGPRFWPRWIREGKCYNGRSCSIPAGMTCQPKQSAKKTILWWHCYKRKHKACRWIPIKYPIITRCACAC